ncbi:putative membrane protein [Streptococcus sp. oral taxon 056 str. F0418]|uniref:DUF1361 domain-containing protein n=1 Tax=Streptococcus sp. oral taxon 056 TaxID=712620 RepID=UPI000218102B|nr:DUF1361 domain-containing protein [Streptococcus sp. oral taxon 056]EGP66006.1 putative membrane protein [Streptococcus sp. oral taxon 056 str. F0418]
MRKVITVHLFFLALSFLVYMEGIAKTGPDLIWNMMLALIAYDFAVLTRYFKQAWLFPILFILWLVFYPNTFYMITDIVHMHWVGDTLWNRASLHLFMVFVPSILFGIYCGIESWLILLERFKFSWCTELLATLVLSVISSMAIYIGRYDRLNTWDLVSNPGQVVQKLLETFQRERLLFILGFTFIQFMSLVFLSQNNKKS